MPDTNDFWPANIADSNLTTPATILKEQAALLGEKTRQLVKGEVVTQPGRLHLLDHARAAAVDQHLVERLVAAHSDVLLDVGGIDQPAIAQDDLLLPLEKGNRIPRRDIRVALAVAHVPGHVVPLLDLAVNEIRRDGPRGKPLQI